jgi:uncharacterized protein (TIGR03437 family)
MKACAILLFAWSACAQSVWFEPNRGQVAGRTEWIGRSKGAYLYITGDEVVYANQKNVHMRLVGASKRAIVEGAEPTGGYSSYFTGRDEKTWFTGIPHYARLRYQDVYPGVDMVYYGSGRNVEYDFVVQAGGDPEQIELAFSEPIHLEDGDLLVAGLRQRRPRVVQAGREIQATYRVTQENHVQLALGAYDRSTDLTVDPVLEFSTYLGGPGDDGAFSVKVDTAGNIYLAGGTQSPASPTLDPFQQTNIVGMAPFLFKLSSDGRRILYYVILGANGYDTAKGLAVDASGSPIIIGNTRSPMSPLKNAFQTELRAASGTAFVTKLTPDFRTLAYSSYLGGSTEQSANSVALDAQANVFIFGETQSKDFPVKSAIQHSFGGGYQDCFVSKVSISGELIASTYLGGSAGEWCEVAEVAPGGDLMLGGGSGSVDYPLKNAIQTEPSPTGYNSPLLVLISPDLQAIHVATFLGGAAYGDIRSLTSDSLGGIYVGGSAGPNLPTTRDAIQPTATGASSFIAKLDLSSRRILYASYLGGGSTSFITGLVLDNQGFLYASGSASAPDFPVKNAIQPWRGGVNNSDCFLAKLTTAGALVYSTPLGGAGNEICLGHVAVNQAGDAYTAGTTWSQDFPIKNAYQSIPGGGADAFLLRISDATAALPSPLLPERTRLSFRYTLGGPAPPSQSITVAGGAFGAAVNQPWTTVAVNGSTLTVSMNLSGLPVGNYTAQVTLTPASGTPAVVDVALSVLGQRPVLTAVEPSFVAVGADDLIVSIRGSGFATDARVLVDGILWTVTPVQFVDGSTLRFSMPKSYFSVEYNHAIAVQNPNSDPSNVLSVAVGIAAPVFSEASVTNAASFTSGPVAPGEIITIFGANLDAKVTLDNIPATLVYSSATQVSVTVPYSITGPTTILRSGSSAPVTLLVAPSAPGIFTAVADPANAGIVTLYATGCGTLTSDSLPRCALPISMTVNGQPADVLYAGIAPGLVEGANQINIRLPNGIGTGPLRIVLQAGEAASKEFLFTLP